MASRTWLGPLLLAGMAAGSQVALKAEDPLQWISDAQSCPNAQLSCHNTSIVPNLCCFNYPGGQMLSTQFWDTNPPTGPSDSWTLHGLWPDRCDGTFDANCDDSRAIRKADIGTILKSFGATDLLSNMSKYWKDYQGNDENLWMHEWNKHGTCVSTLEPSCYSSYKSQEEVVDYFNTAVALYTKLDTYKWLSEAGIVPSTSATYTRDQIQSVLSAKHGKPVSLGCKSGKLDEVWYHFDVLGSLQNGKFIAADTLGGKQTCPATGIRYPPKGNSQPTGTHTAVPAPAPTGPAFSGKGFLRVSTQGSAKGCIISSGSWYVSGTCATFTATQVDGGFTLATRKGKCAVGSVKKGAFSCAPTINQATVFDSKDGMLTHGGDPVFYAETVPRGWKQVPVYVQDPGHGTEVAISWEST